MRMAATTTNTAADAATTNINSTTIILGPINSGVPSCSMDKSELNRFPNEEPSGSAGLHYITLHYIKVIQSGLKSKTAKPLNGVDYGLGLIHAR